MPLFSSFYVLNNSLTFLSYLLIFIFIHCYRILYYVFNFFFNLFLIVKKVLLGMCVCYFFIFIIGFELVKISHNILCYTVSSQKTTKKLKWNDIA